MSRVSLEANPGRERRSTWGLKDEEYVADFCLVSRRFLTAYCHKIFTYHYLLGADWKLCCQKLHVDRGTFFHHIYRIEQQLGRTFRELEPHALFPLDQYFNGAGKPSQDATAVFAPYPVETETEDEYHPKPRKKVLKFPVQPSPFDRAA